MTETNGSENTTATDTKHSDHIIQGERDNDERGSDQEHASDTDHVEKEQAELPGQGGPHKGNSDAVVITTVTPTFEPDGEPEPLVEVEITTNDEISAADLSKLQMLAIKLSTGQKIFSEEYLELQKKHSSLLEAELQRIKETMGNLKPDAKPEPEPEPEAKAEPAATETETEKEKDAVVIPHPATKAVTTFKFNMAAVLLIVGVLLLIVGGMILMNQKKTA